MNAGEKMRRRKQAKRQQMLRLWLPVLLVVVLIGGLTAGGVGLSLAQNGEIIEKASANKGASDDQKETKPDDTKPGESAQEPQSVPGGTDEDETGGTDPAADGDAGTEQQEFEAFVSNLRDAVSTDSEYLAEGSTQLASTSVELQAFNRSLLTDSQQLMYDTLKDYVDLEDEGNGYADVKAAAEGVACSSVEGGVDYYNYLLRKYSGLDGTWDTFRAVIADEVNANFQEMNNLAAQDESVPVTAAGYTKQSPDEAYTYSTRSADSDILKKAVVNNGFINGWNEYGVIASHRSNAELTDSVRSYLIHSTRMTFAIYAIADVSVHGGSWTLEDVRKLCADYYGAAGGESFASSVYDMIMNSPGRYAAACLDYLQIADLESVLSQQEGYTEERLYEALFDQGPAPFRVLRDRLGL